ncbi:MAG: hypothetical protein QWI73_06135 [Alphaproteobacteria bacterium]|nr:hypothetical protein [Alphaproteobacteria bacterium]MDN5249647.1 hypothetical protein [Alphaproteobacteria bacterium]
MKDGKATEPSRTKEKTTQLFVVVDIGHFFPFFLMTTTTTTTIAVIPIRLHWQLQAVKS